MADSLDRQLLRQAWRLARLDRAGRPQQANLRRAVSSAYYALFHFLVNHACRTMLGTSNERRPYRDTMARAFQHGQMAKACRSFGGGTLPKTVCDSLPSGFAVPADLRVLSQTFCSAQEQRHLADYAPGASFLRSDVFSLIREVEQAMASFANIRSLPETQFFLVSLLAWGTLTNR